VPRGPFHGLAAPAWRCPRLTGRIARDDRGQSGVARRRGGAWRFTAARFRSARKALRAGLDTACDRPGGIARATKSYPLLMIDFADRP